MKWILAALFLAAPASVRAQAQVEEHVSSATYGNIQLSTYTPTRVDNITSGGAVGVLNGRNIIKLTELLAGPTIYIGFDSKLSTQTGSAFRGAQALGGGTGKFELEIAGSSALQVWAFPDAPGVAGPTLNVIQASPVKQ